MTEINTRFKSPIRALEESFITDKVLVRKINKGTNIFMEEEI
jgi:hypothetical protein